jgi:FkbH-like protein
MLLKRQDISAFVANWDDKAQNLKAIAAQLNIGLDSLVFVDDNPVERARIRQSLPMVAVPELPQDIAHYVRYLADAGYFEAVAFTSEDRLRTEQYVANAEREALLKVSGNLDDFLASLQMSVVFGKFTKADLVRITQLFSKTNQFNTTTKRYTAEEVASFAAAEETVTLQFRLLDKFGDNGLVSAMILRPDPKQPEVLEIDNWVMSCRVFGRQLEFEALNIAVEQARRRGSKALRADYIPTPKNGVISELYPSLGFFPLSDKTGSSCWILELAKYVARPTHISRSGEAR